MVATIQLLSGLVGSLAFLSQASAGPLVTEQVRIMALGDSITGNPVRFLFLSSPYLLASLTSYITSHTNQKPTQGCWRALLSRKLSATNIDLPLPYSQIRFVGTQQRTYCGYGSAYDWPHEGHGRFLATGIASTTVPILSILPDLPLLTQPLLTSWLLNPDVSLLGRPVDIVLMHLGTNDIWQGRPTAEILGAYGALLNQMRAVNLRVLLLVAKILPMQPANCPSCAAKVQELNTYIPLWAAYVNGQNVLGQVG